MLEFLWLHLIFVLGGILGGAGLLLLVRDPRRRTHTLTWLVIIVLAPYIGIPLFLMIGTRRSNKTFKVKGALSLSACHDHTDSVTGIGRSIKPLLEGMGMQPPSCGNRFELLPDGIATWNRFAQLIESSTKSIEIETYVFNMDATGTRLRDLLAEKARAGVKVRLLIDSLGSHATKKSFMQPVIDAGGEVSWFIPIIHRPWRASGDTRNHRKIALFDRQHVIAGGSNLGEEYIGPTPVDGRWVDINFHVEGPVVTHYFEVFRNDWQFSTRGILDAAPAPVVEPKGHSLAQVIPSGVDVPGDVLYNAVVTAVYEARRRLWITTPYFVPDEPLTQALALAARRGIDLRIIIPDVSNQKLADIARGPAVRHIIDWGGRVIRYTGGMFHAKTLVADDDWALVGSMNTDRRSLFLNFEVMLSLYNQDDVKIISDWNSRLMDPSQEGAKTVTGRHRLWESMVRLLAPEL